MTVPLSINNTYASRGMVDSCFQILLLDLMHSETFSMYAYRTTGNFDEGKFDKFTIFQH